MYLFNKSNMTYKSIFIYLLLLGSMFVFAVTRLERSMQELIDKIYYRYTFIEISFDDTLRANLSDEGASASSIVVLDKGTKYVIVTSGAVEKELYLEIKDNRGIIQEILTPRELESKVPSRLISREFYVKTGSNKKVIWFIPSRTGDYTISVTLKSDSEATRDHTVFLAIGFEILDY